MDLKARYKINYYNPIAINRKQIKNQLKEKIKTVKAFISNKIKTLIHPDSICISLDISTANVNHISYIGMILYYIDNSSTHLWEFKSLMIAFLSFIEKHSTKNIDL